MYTAGGAFILKIKFRLRKFIFRSGLVKRLLRKLHPDGKLVIRVYSTHESYYIIVWNEDNLIH